MTMLQDYEAALARVEVATTTIGEFLRTVAAKLGSMTTDEEAAMKIRLTSHADALVAMAASVADPVPVPVPAPDPAA